VLRFSLGFGKPLLKRVSRDADRVEYVLSAIPLGGYVRLLDERDGPVPPGEEHRAFNRRPPLARVAGAARRSRRQFVFAIVAYWLLFMQGIPGLKPVIGEVAPDSYAARADLRELDEITSVAGEPTPTRQAAILKLLEGVVDSGEVPFAVRRAGGETRSLVLRVPETERRALTEPGILLHGLGFSFWYPPQPVVVGELTPGFPAAAAGLAIGDRVLEVEGQPIDDYVKFVDIVRARPGEATRIAVLRNGKRLEFTLVPKSEIEEGRTVGKIGLGAALGDGGGFPEKMKTVERYGPFAAIAPSVARPGRRARSPCVSCGAWSRVTCRPRTSPGRSTSPSTPGSPQRRDSATTSASSRWCRSRSGF
jgi:regulator of sigma E protease